MPKENEKEKKMAVFLGICVKSKAVLPKIQKLKQNKKKKWTWKEEKTAYAQNEQMQV